QQDFLNDSGQDGGSVSAVTDTAPAREPVGDLGPEDGDGRAGLSALVGEDHRDAQVVGDLARDRRRERANMAEEPLRSTRVPAREVGPRRRDDRQVDAVAVVAPDLAVNHVGADRETDPAPARRDDERRTAGPEPEPFPEDEVTLAVDVN